MSRGEREEGQKESPEEKAVRMLGDPSCFVIEVSRSSPNLLEQRKARHPVIVEPVSASLCVQERLDRFTLGSKAKLDVQWTLFALVHNIGYIYTFGALI